MICSSNTTCMADTGRWLARWLTALPGPRARILVAIVALPVVLLGAILVLMPQGEGDSAPASAASETGDGPDQSVESARAALARGDAIAAEVELRRALAAGAGDDAVAAFMGEAYLMRGDMLAARHWLGKGRFTAATRGHGYRMLGRLELQEGNLGDAAQAYDKALESLPRDAGLWVDIGRMRYRGGEQAQAIEAVVHALELDPNHARALEFRGQLLRDSVGLKAALPLFERALKNAPDDVAIMGEYAATLGELGRATEMLAVTRRMLEQDEHNSRAFFLQAVLAARAGQDDLARHLLWRTQNAYRTMPAAMLLQGVLELRVGNHATATDIFERLARQQPDNALVATLLARSLAQGQAWHEIALRFAPMAEREDASAYLLTLVGRALEALDRREDAAAFLDRAARVPKPVLAPRTPDAPIGVLSARWMSDPSMVLNSIAFTRAQLAHGRSQEAVLVAEELRSRYADSADTQLLAADARFLAGDHAGALALYGKVARIRLAPALLQRLVMTHDALGRQEAADSLLQEQAAQHPMYGPIAFLVAERARRQGDWAVAASQYHKASGLPGGSKDPQLLSGLALALLKTGDARAALGLAEHAYRLQPMHPQATLALGLALQAQAPKDPRIRPLMAKAARLGAAGYARPGG